MGPSLLQHETKKIYNPFDLSVTFLCPLKTPEKENW